MFKKYTGMRSAFTLRPYGVLALYFELNTPNEFLVLMEYKSGKNDIFQSKGTPFLAVGNLLRENG